MLFQKTRSSVRGFPLQGFRMDASSLTLLYIPADYISSESPSLRDVLLRPFSSFLQRTGILHRPMAYQWLARTKPLDVPRELTVF